METLIRTSVACPNYFMGCAILLGTSLDGPINQGCWSLSSLCTFSQHIHEVGVINFYWIESSEMAYSRTSEPLSYAYIYPASLGKKSLMGVSGQ